MLHEPPDPEVAPARVRTLAGGHLSGGSDHLCPVCKEVPLLGKQTVCSGRCRIERSRQKKVQQQAAMHSQLRLHLRQIQADSEAALKLLRERVNNP